jgi:queuine/archaeosine tRNA-ribosyltransferase
MKMTISDMQEIAKGHRGKCLSEEYINSVTKLTWQCKNGHRWDATPHSLHQGNWCPVCAGVQKGTIEEMLGMAKERGGQCLSEKYVGALSKLKWQCKEGHQWEARPAHIKQGSWCPACAAGMRRGTIKEMQRIAEERGGQCLSEKYINSRSKVKWQCKNGHQWEATPASIKQGGWCPACAGVQKGTIEDMQKIAEERGGQCLSEKYINSGTKLKWQCKEGHQWEAAPASIKRGSWCRFCAVRLGTVPASDQGRILSI